MAYSTFKKWYSLMISPACDVSDDIKHFEYNITKKEKCRIITNLLFICVKERKSFMVS